IERHVFEVAKDGKFFEMRMDDAQPFGVAGEIRAAAGIDEECARESGRGAIGAAGFDGGFFAGVRKTRDGPAFTHLAAAASGVFEQEIIDDGAHDLDRYGLARTTPAANVQLV